MEIFPSVVQSVPGENFTVYAYCNDGAVRLVDIKPMIAQGGVFAALANETVFCNALTVLNDTVAWDIEGNRDPATCIDLDPFLIFDTAPLVADPLGEVG